MPFAVYLLNGCHLTIFIQAERMASIGRSVVGEGLRPSPTTVADSPRLPPSPTLRTTSTGHLLATPETRLQRPPPFHTSRGWSVGEGLRPSPTAFTADPVADSPRLPPPPTLRTTSTGHLLDHPRDPPTTHSLISYLTRLVRRGGSKTLPYGVHRGPPSPTITADPTDRPN